MRILHHTAIRAAVMAVIVLGVSVAQTRSTEQTQAILDFKLTMPVANRLLAAIGPMTQYVASLPDVRERMARASKQTLAERVAAVEKDPKAMAILKQNNLTAREYLVGILALRYAVWLAAPGNSGNPNPNIVASPANLAFARANLSELKPRMEAADGMTGRK
jgi:hypothetical protein